MTVRVLLICLGCRCLKLVKLQYTDLCYFWHFKHIWQIFGWFHKKTQKKTFRKLDKEMATCNVLGSEFSDCCVAVHSY